MSMPSVYGQKRAVLCRTKTSDFKIKFKIITHRGREDHGSSSIPCDPQQQPWGRGGCRYQRTNDDDSLESYMEGQGLAEDSDLHVEARIQLHRNKGQSGEERRPYNNTVPDV